MTGSSASDTASRAEIIQQRLDRHGLVRPIFATPAEVVAKMGAVQAQDFHAAKWALGLRVPGSSPELIEQALVGKQFVRTWALRGTLHFVAAADVRWILALLGPGLILRHGSYERRLGLDEATFAHSRAVLGRVLQGGQALTRKELAAALEQAEIATQGLRMAFLLYRAALEGQICLGPPRGKQATHVLLEEWLPPTPAKTREEALAELARRYFNGHGPALLKDFTWWSGLTAGEARAAVEMVQPELFQEKMDEQTYFLTRPGAGSGDNDWDGLALLPVFDEYLVGYSDRSTVVAADRIEKLPERGGVLNPVLLIGGQVAGIWRRTFEQGKVVIAVRPFTPLAPTQREAMSAAADRYAHFLGLPCKLMVEESGS